MTEDKFKRPTRRTFLGASAATGLTLLTSRKADLLAAPDAPGTKQLNAAFCGVNGRGGDDLRALGPLVNVVALCDVDSNSLNNAAKNHPEAKLYRDYRRLMDDAKSFDLVCVATPDHMHAPIAMAAIRLGKHVYVEKPMAHDLFEVRALTEAARQAKVMTQMGNQGHSSDATRLFVEWVAAGAVGTVSEVHVWSDRPIWPQAFKMPTRTAEPPPTLDWDLWLGSAPSMPYYIEEGVGGTTPSPIHPFKWRGWWNFGTGALGDMGCHIFDASYWACGLTAPTAVEAEQSGSTDYCGPAWSIIRYDFPATAARPPIKLTWYDGGKLPPRPPEMEPDREIKKGSNGTLIVGDRGTMLLPHAAGSGPRLIPESKMKQFKRPEPTIPRIGGQRNGHHRNFVEACLTGKPAGSNFDYAGPLTEIVLLGNVAIRAGKRIEWDSANQKITNAPELNHLLRREYRRGWEL
jgi:predicted dehydrogenase